MGRFVDGYATLLVRDECGAGSPLLGNQQRCHELNIGNLHYLRSIMTMGFVEAASTSSGVVMGFLRFGSGASDNYGAIRRGWRRSRKVSVLPYVCGVPTQCGQANE